MQYMDYIGGIVTEKRVSAKKKQYVQGHWRQLVRVGDKEDCTAVHPHGIIARFQLVQGSSGHEVIETHSHLKTRVLMIGTGWLCEL